MFSVWTALALTALWLSIRYIQGSPHTWSCSGLNSFIFFSGGDPGTRHMLIGLVCTGIVLTVLFQTRLDRLHAVLTAVAVSAVLTGSISAFFVPHSDRIAGQYGTPLYTATRDGCCVEVFNAPAGCRDVTWIRRPCPGEPCLLLTVNGIADSIMCHLREPPFPDTKTPSPASDLDMLMELRAGGHVVSDGISGGAVARACLRNSCTLEIFEPRQAVINTAADVFGSFTGELLHSPGISIRNTVLTDLPPRKSAHLYYLDLTRYIPSPWTRSSPRKYISADGLSAMLTRQETGPIIAIKCFRFEPPREIPRILCIAASALQQINKEPLSDRLMVIASAETATVMLSADPFPMKTIAYVNWFVRHSAEFDALYAPGIPFETALTQWVRALDPASPDTGMPSSDYIIDPPQNPGRIHNYSVSNQVLKHIWYDGHTVRRDLNNPGGHWGLWFYAILIVLIFLFLI